MSATTYKIIDIEQGSLDWYDFRRGYITASRFKDLMTNGKSGDAQERINRAHDIAKNISLYSDTQQGEILMSIVHELGVSLATVKGYLKKEVKPIEPGEGFDTYVMEKVAEITTGEFKDFSNNATDWGNEYEGEAADSARKIIKYDFKKCGFITHTNLSMVGGSPDRVLFNYDEEIFGGLEIKCPYNPTNHLKTILSKQMPKEHYAQVQGLIWLTGTDGWYFMSYDPRQKPELQAFIRYIKRDQEYIDKLDSRIRLAVERRDNILKELDSIKMIEL